MSTVLQAPSAGQSTHRTVAVPDFERIRLLARNILESSGCIEPPIYTDSIAENYNLKVMHAGFKDKYNEVAAIIECDCSRIIVNERCTEEQCNYAVAHGLGHKILLHDVCADEAGFHLIYAESIRQKNLIDIEANFFAMNLLVPDSILREFLDEFSFATDEQLASVFAVPLEVLKIRRRYI